jgi:hypothetical protein
MTSAEIVMNGQPLVGQLGHTYGCLDPIEIAPLDALMDDVRRTQAHIMWLEKFIALLPEDLVFHGESAMLTEENERARIGKPTVVGSIRWQMEVERKKQIASKQRTQATHPAVKQLLDERRHLVDVCAKAMALGIKLDAIDYTRKQADLIVGAMSRFAISNNLNPEDPTVRTSIIDALEGVLADSGAN